MGASAHEAAGSDTITPIGRHDAGARHGRVRVLHVIDERGICTIPLPRGAVTVGRAPECDIVLRDRAVSRLHARLHVGEKLEVEDLGSANGTFVSGRVLSPGTRAVCEEPECIVVGDTSLLLDTTLPTASLAVAPRCGPGAPRAGGDASEPTPSSASPRMKQVYALCDQVAVTPYPVLILGETGAGKDVLASLIHRRSYRRVGPFVRINCAAIAPSLLESELFGHQAGAFTGASTAKPGLLEMADGGTVFLDEVGELPPPLQAKLLHVVESGEVSRVGAVKTRRLDVRFLCATNRELSAEVERGAFRSDFFYRISAFTIELPPLRERKEEIDHLTGVLLDQIAAQLELPRPKRLDAEARAALVRYDWPGNVRELRNVICRATVLAAHEVIGCHDLRLPQSGARRAPLPGRDDGAGAPLHREPLSGMLERERQRIIAALAQCAGNQARAAVALGMSRRHLVRRLAALDIPRPRD
jgi:DNA-binding NtrC family response regulator